MIHALRTAHISGTQLILMADQKANILMGIIAIVFTIFISRTGTLEIMSHNFALPIILFLLMESCSFMFALLVLLPRNSNNKASSIEKMGNPLYFGHFTQFSETEYCRYIENNMTNNQQARHLLSKDLYQIGKILVKKYKLLRYAYSFTYIGIFILVVFVFIQLAFPNLY